MADKALLKHLRSQMNAVGASASCMPSAAMRNDVDHVRDHDLTCNQSYAFSRDPARGEIEPISSEASEQAFRKIIALVNVSDRSEKAIRERLMRFDFPEDAIDASIERARSYGFVDDDRFARTLIRSRLSQGRGIPGIERELLGHEIDMDSVSGWPEEFEVDENLELKRALALLEKRPPHSKNLRDGAYRKLVGKGFSSSVASSAARIWAESKCD